jgi:hypothetical protein
VRDGRKGVGREQGGTAMTTRAHGAVAPLLALVVGTDGRDDHSVARHHCASARLVVGTSLQASVLMIKIYEA